MPASNQYKDRAKSLVTGKPSAAPSASSAPAQASLPTATVPTASDGTQSATASSGAAAQPAVSSLRSAAEDRAYDAFMKDLPNYLSRLTFMVYFNEKSSPDPQIAKMSVAQAIRYLKERNQQDGTSITVIDVDQIEKNKQDQLDAYKAGTGEEPDIIQYIAEKFNANVYVEIDFTVSTEKRDDKYYASAQGALKMFDVSTASVLGAVSFQNTTFSPNSEFGAASNAVVSAVWYSMPKVYDQARSLLSASLQRGLRYEVVVQRSVDSKKISQFERQLGSRLRDVQELSFSQGETKLDVYSFQSKAAVRDAVFEAAAQAGMPDFDLLLSRGNSFTFTSGL